jgi:GDP-L-fucose synthase
MHDLKSRHVLVTGASGLVGSTLIPRLLEAGAKVRATHRRRELPYSDKDVEKIHADLTQPAACQQAVEGVEYVFHCAANTSGAATMATTPMVHVTPNVIMNSLLLESAYHAGVTKFLWLSSTTGYPVSGDAEVREEEMFNGDPFEKYYFVGWMKRFTEVLCKMYGEKLPRKMATLVLRPTNIYGVHDDFEFATSHVIPALIRKVVERWNPLEVWGTGDDVRDAIYVDDMVDAMLLAIRKLDAHAAINIGYGEAYSVKQILALLLEIDEFADAKIVFNTSKPTMIPIRKVDLTRARELLGFQARTSLRDGLAKTIAWYRREKHQLVKPA